MLISTFLRSSATETAVPQVLTRSGRKAKLRTCLRQVYDVLLFGWDIHIGMTAPKRLCVSSPRAIWEQGDVVDLIEPSPRLGSWRHGMGVTGRNNVCGVTKCRDLVAGRSCGLHSANSVLLGFDILGRLLVAGQSAELIQASSREAFSNWTTLWRKHCQIAEIPANRSQGPLFLRILSCSMLCFVCFERFAELVHPTAQQSCRNLLRL